MNLEALAPYGLTVIVGIIGWFVRVLSEADKELRESLSKTREEMPRSYVLREDYRRDIYEIKDLLKEIYRIWLRFADGVEGEVDLENEQWGEMFEPQKDPSRFAEFALEKELETIVWPNGADFAPEFLYKELRPDYTLKPAPSELRT